MEVRRAQEIIADPRLIDVVYQGSHVYLQQINEQKNTANIYHLSNPNNKQEVTLDSLIEQ